MRESGLEVEQIIDSDEPLVQLKDYFNGGLAALEYFGKTMQARYSSTRRDGLCDCCKLHSTSKSYSYHWSALVRPRFAFTRTDALLLLAGRVGLSIAYTKITFQTCHHLCQGCSARVAWSRHLAIVVKAISFFLLLVGLVMTLFGGLGCLLIGENPFVSKDIRFMLYMFILGVIAVSVSCGGHAIERRMRIPAYIRTVGRKPFDLIRVTEIPKLLATH
jgi:hypothetical protein